MTTTSRPTVGPDSVARVVAVGLGGAVGASLRWGVDVAMAIDGWPAATLVANLLGTFVLAAASRVLGASHWGVGARVGLLGAFTTFSALVVQAVVLVDRPVVAAGYLVASLGGGVLAALAGLRLSVARPPGGPRA